MTFLFNKEFQVVIAAVKIFEVKETPASINPGHLLKLDANFILLEQ